jgi:hypothetical protein
MDSTSEGDRLTIGELRSQIQAIARGKLLLAPTSLLRNLLKRLKSDLEDRGSFRVS